MATTQTVPAPPETRPRVSEGMLLIVREKGIQRVRFDWWVVKSVRAPRKNGDVSATLIRGSESMSATATATFPGGLVNDPWRVVKLTQGDWNLIYEGARP